MSANRTSGGIYGSSGKNVNPIYAQIQKINNYVTNASKEFTEQRTAKAKYGADSKQYKEANRQVKGAVLQARRYDSNGNQIK
jgi:hypothetical protein